MACCLFENQMHPELFQIPIIDLTIKSYGLMMAVAFVVALVVIKRLSRYLNPAPQFIANAALYSLLAGIIGARLFYVLHYFEKFRVHLLSVFAIWQGGLELLGGVLFAIAVIIFYLRRHNQPVRRYLDILAIGLLVALTFGRIGCFLNGCCFGQPTELPWAVQFPYGSFSYESQVFPDPDRNRPKPQLELPDEFFTYYSTEDGRRIRILKPKEQLTEDQKRMVTEGKYRALPVHPTELYSSANALLLSLVLYGLWRRAREAEKAGKLQKALTKPGCIFSLMFIFYGITRFAIEMVRGDNPFEIYRLTIAQLMCFALIAAGAALIFIVSRLGPDSLGRKPKPG